MNNTLLKKLITAGIMILLFIIAVKVLVKLLGFIIGILLPAAVLILAAYIVYKMFTRR